MADGGHAGLEWHQRAQVDAQVHGLFKHLIAERYENFHGLEAVAHSQESVDESIVSECDSSEMKLWQTAGEC